ncbi:DUF6929 family protein [Flavobacterium sp.]|uniref:DUF6929 family protein n=1 Tax=Flavobacterium sp. TaxID=239 RepID=UPI0039E3414E
MNPFTLELLFNIIGIGSASGLTYKDNTLLLIGDNSGFLYEYQMDDQSLNHHALIEHPKANIPKKEKPDFEAITFDDQNVYVFGSGSTENRNKMVTLDRQTKKTTATTDLTNLYLSMQSFAQIAPEDFNIEGVVYTPDSWYFFQRGNGANGKNGIFSVNAKNLEGDFTMVYNEYELPKIKGVQASFTDAVIVGDALWFLAAAENTQSTYLDGDILGSLIGYIDLKKMKLRKTQIISEKNKFEGLALFSDSKKQIQFLLCEDNDTDRLESGIYKLTLQK